ncbi:enoyl-CoA hydratase/isomerase family protein [Labilibacter marinus]|uniref:enoyl-CoA hydratase/isomerase family protein n=1 Tax=Labilibacter marinus TaxID=1477105 RepID=UPI0008348168|nr:enoyl-CoA hydratase-related protein [Labilibacter marinus]
MEQHITLQKKNRVGYIIINRPKANCYEINFHKQLIECIDKANDDADIKVIVLKSALEKFFCAGADIKVFEANTVEANKLMVEHAQLAANKLADSKKITLAAISGHALGGGLELAMACDLRLAAEGTYFLGLPEIKLGLIPGNGGSQRLIRLIDKSKALELLITGDNIGPKEAYNIGLVNHLYSKEEFNDKLEAYAEKLAQGPVDAMAAVKVCVNKGLEMSLKEGLALEGEMVEPLYDSEDAKEGGLAFVEKRAPQFK